jgi:hypothetical protein
MTNLNQEVARSVAQYQLSLNGSIAPEKRPHEPLRAHMMIDAQQTMYRSL